MSELTETFKAVYRDIVQRGLTEKWQRYANELGMPSGAFRNAKYGNYISRKQSENALMIIEEGKRLISNFDNKYKETIKSEPSNQT